MKALSTPQSPCLSFDKYYFHDSYDQAPDPCGGFVWQVSLFFPELTPMNRQNSLAVTQIGLINFADDKLQLPYHICNSSPN